MFLQLCSFIFVRVGFIIVCLRRVTRQGSEISVFERSSSSRFRICFDVSS
jgi:hypothetical protein